MQPYMVFLASTGAFFIAQSMSMTSCQSANAAMHGSRAKFPHWDADFLMHNTSRVKVVEARKRLQNENCHQDDIKRNIKSKVLQQTPFWTLFMVTVKKKRRVLVTFCMKTAKMCFSKHASTLDVAMVTTGGWRRLKINCCFEN